MLHAVSAGGLNVNSTAVNLKIADYRRTKSPSQSERPFAAITPRYTRDWYGPTSPIFTRARTRHLRWALQHSQVLISHERQRTSVSPTVWVLLWLPLDSTLHCPHVSNPPSTRLNADLRDSSHSKDQSKIVVLGPVADDISGFL
jgi:hypothetical protein